MFLYLLGPPSTHICDKILFFFFLLTYFFVAIVTGANHNFPLS